MSVLIAFDADVLIYAAITDSPMHKIVSDLVSGNPQSPIGIGSLLLLTEVLGKPLRTDKESEESTILQEILSHIELLPVNEDTATISLALSIKYGLRAADATHLATAIVAGADEFWTNNSKDFTPEISEIKIVHPEI